MRGLGGICDKLRIQWPRERRKPFLRDHVATRVVDDDDLFFQLKQGLEIYTIHIGADWGGVTFCYRIPYMLLVHSCQRSVGNASSELQRITISACLFLCAGSSA